MTRRQLAVLQAHATGPTPAMRGADLAAARWLVGAGYLKPHYRQLARGEDVRRFTITKAGKHRLRNPHQEKENMSQPPNATIAGFSLAHAFIADADEALLRALDATERTPLPRPATGTSASGGLRVCKSLQSQLQRELTRAHAAVTKARAAYFEWREQHAPEGGDGHASEGA